MPSVLSFFILSMWFLFSCKINFSPNTNSKQKNQFDHRTMVAMLKHWEYAKRVFQAWFYPIHDDFLYFDKGQGWVLKSRKHCWSRSPAANSINDKRQRPKWEFPWPNSSWRQIQSSRLYQSCISILWQYESEKGWTSNVADAFYRQSDIGHFKSEPQVKLCQFPLVIWAHRKFGQLRKLSKDHMQRTEFVHCHDYQIMIQKKNHQLHRTSQNTWGRKILNERLGKVR